VALLSAIVGITADVPAGAVTVRPMTPSPVGALAVDGLRVAGEPLSLSVAADGSLGTIDAPPGLTVGTAQPAR
jgi:hypothetical protein